jgi:lysosomal alpha-mannosidase
MKFFSTAALKDIPEIETLVKGIDVSDGQGKEVVLRILNDIDNKEEFYTDSNGLDLLYRKIDWHPTYQYKEKNDVAANYYPINAMIGIEGKAKDFLSGSNLSLYLVNDRSQGGTSWGKGSLELMIHRATTMDDSRGVGEPMQEKDKDGKPMPARLRHYVVFDGAEKAKEMQQRQDS